MLQSDEKVRISRVESAQVRCAQVLPLHHGPVIPSVLCTAAFVSGGLLPASVRGTVQHGMIHVCDWCARCLRTHPNNNPFASTTTTADSRHIYQCTIGIAPSVFSRVFCPQRELCRRSTTMEPKSLLSIVSICGRYLQRKWTALRARASHSHNLRSFKDSTSMIATCVLHNLV